MDTEEHLLNFIWYRDRFGNEDYVDLDYFPCSDREEVEHWLENQQCKVLK
jgi:hypothetical protein